MSIKNFLNKIKNKSVMIYNPKTNKIIDLSKLKSKKEKF